MVAPALSDSAHRRGDRTLNVGWAILLPRPSYAGAD
jgi:hypothetical protein